MQRKYLVWEHKYLVWALLLLLAGCASLVKPVSVRQSIAYTEGALTATYQSIGQLKAEGRISAEKRNELVAQADKVGDALDASRLALGVGDISTAEGKLQAARAVLVTLEAVLKQYGG
jgi:hypothetical protein